MSKAEAAALLSKSERTVDRRIADGSLPSVRVSNRVMVPLVAVISQQHAASATSRAPGGQ